MVGILDEAFVGKEQDFGLGKSGVQVDGTREIVCVFQDLVEFGQVPQDYVSMRLQDCERDKEDELIGIVICP